MANEWPTNTQRIPTYINFHQVTTGTWRAYLWVSGETLRDRLQHARHTLGIRWPFVAYSLTVVFTSLNDLFVGWTLVIRSAFVPHSLGIRLIRQEFAKRNRFWPKI